MESKLSLANSPKVSVGMPVFNGEPTLRRAIESILAQSYINLELVISDNSSIDSTDKICKEYALIDKRIIYIRQPKNIGAEANFKNTLSRARGLYFMWAACDDSWHPSFIERNIANLEANPNAISSISNVLLDGKKFPEADSGVSPLTGSEVSKLRTLCRQPGANSRFYSLFRKSALDGIAMHRGYVAADWSIICDLIRKGDMLTISDYYGFFKSLSGAGSSPKKFIKNNKPPIEFIFPFAQFSKDILARTLDPLTIIFLIRLNSRANVERLKYFIEKK